MTEAVKDYSEAIYAGVLGKIIGVYLGRPVEGWAYEKIQQEFGELHYYVHEECGVPLVVADDDISGTFGFFKTLHDYDYQNLTSKNFGQTWLNYIIEDKTVLWWGGLGRSTEHTAFLRLKNGVEAPMSGSIASNGTTLAEQIGAQIFIDAIAMACPDDPDLAVKLIKESASVSHDGMAVEAACFLGAMQAMAFSEKNLDVLLDKGMAYLTSEHLISAIQDVRYVCSRVSDWRKVREYMNPKYGYEVYPGCCHIIPNHLMVIASLLLGGDDFQKSIMIASSAGWDTDCNAGNVGCLNGIRLGLAGINQGANFRKPVSDLMYVVTADGGSVVTDAVKEALKIVEASYRLKGLSYDKVHKKYDFSFKGSTQGFEPCPQYGHKVDVVRLSNRNETAADNGLLVTFADLAKGTVARVSTPTFIDFDKLAKNFSTVASPTLYSGQTVYSTLVNGSGAAICVRQYALYYDIDDSIKTVYADERVLEQGESILEWEIPDTRGMPIFRLGYEWSTDQRFNGSIVIQDVDWNGAPSRFYQKGMMMTSIWHTHPFWLQTWTSSAKHFAADFKYTFCISHHEKNGLVTIGSRDWDHYSVASRLSFSLHDKAGLVARSNGHRRYYAAVFESGNRVSIIARRDDDIQVLASVPFPYEEDRMYNAKFTVRDNHLTLEVDGQQLAAARDEKRLYAGGSAGFLMEAGTMVADGFIIDRV
ncbi:ADP-ribosylglycohydrolase family protein [Paenibacillus paeoniae]|uniref:ADP-ribosylglycohydrolase family protein n=1 Tax=Paenibacillus paeoniae TaxID=2292705 RepID=A0A371PPH9_9BACL|nr:ADP-ribosylglycohydrolase family protein [Paenibacillus paeoniae]REK77727.1 ADP-ribosylglycohydrolase family protein [Paenibacillus paeoniae]